MFYFKSHLLKHNHFFFYRKNAADISLTAEEIKSDLFSDISYLHFGSISLTDEPARTATLQAIELCKKKGGKVCFDPNIRPSLWETEEKMRVQIEQALEKVDIFLPSLSELEFLYKEKEFEEQKAIDYLFEKYPLKLIVVKKQA